MIFNNFNNNHMKNIFTFLMLTICLAITAQTTPSYKNVKLTSVPLGTKNDSLVLWNGSDKLLKYLPVSQFSQPISTLQKINEGNGEGIIIRNRVAANYGNVGLNAVDLSTSPYTSNTTGATGELSFTSGDATTASGYGSSSIGVTTKASGFAAHAEGSDGIATGFAAHTEGLDTEASGDYSHAEGGLTMAMGIAGHSEGYRTSTQGDYSHSEGYNSDAVGNYSHVGGLENNAGTFGETSIGHWGTQIFSGSATTIVPTDRLYNIGNGTSASSRSDAFTLLKNGLGRLPSVTNALIDADATGKSIVTKEYLNSIIASTGALHTTGNEIFSGVKSSTNTSSVKSNGIDLINSGASGSNALYVSNTSTGDGIYLYNSDSNGKGMRIINSQGGDAIYVANQTSGNGYFVNNQSTGSGLKVTNAAGGRGIYSTNSSSGIGVRADNASSGQGIYTNNTSTGIGYSIDNNVGGIGVQITNSGAGKSIVLNNTTAATGIPFTIRKNGVDKLTLNDAGEVGATKYKLSALNTAPATATDIGTLGEIRVTDTHIYVCTAANIWVRTALATW